MMADDEFPVLSRALTTSDPLTPPREAAGADSPNAPDGVTPRPALGELLVMAQRVADTELTVLVSGETGVGKEWLARWLHAHSRRACRRFVPVNCSAIPDTQLDTYLYGKTSGGFSGVVHETLGMFEVASGGTLFLDHIGDASPAMQAQLLGVLEEQQVQRVGEWRLRPIDVRVLAATSHHLEDEVARGRFRQDLFYRLRVVELPIPALRDRPDDLQVLARDLLADAAVRHQRPITGYAPEALALLFAHDWPGNVRELENAIEEACLMATGSAIQMKDLPSTLQRPAVAPSLSAADPSLAWRRLAEFERVLIEAALERHLGDRRRAAEELGISVLTFNRKLRLRGRSHRVRRRGE
jgi:two-component system, NtrC family, response regulator HydG